MVLVKSVPDDNMDHFEPEVTSLEIMPKNRRLKTARNAIDN